MMTHVLGLDEAGRGPVIGSLFVAAVMVHEEELPAVAELGVKDSKKLSDAKREALVPEIEEVAEKIVVKEVTASQIDELREVMSLNVIELNAFADVINQCFPDKAFIDLPEPDGDTFTLKLKAKLDDSLDDLAVTAEHGADDTYPIVSAASIIAKSQREKHVHGLYEKYGEDFGTGYPHDTDTITFLEEYLGEHGELPAETRLSWSTAQRLQDETSQHTLSQF